MTNKKKFTRQKGIKELETSDMVSKISSENIDQNKAKALQSALEEIQSTDTTPGQTKKVKEYSVGDLVYKYIKWSNVLGITGRPFLFKAYEYFQFRYAMHVRETYFIRSEKLVWLYALAMASMRAVTFIKWCADQKETHPELWKCAGCVEHAMYVFQGDLFRTVMWKATKSVVKKIKLNIDSEIKELMDLIEKLIKQ